MSMSNPSGGSGGGGGATARASVEPVGAAELERMRNEESANAWDISAARYSRQERALAAAATHRICVFAFDREPGSGSKSYGVGSRRMAYRWARTTPVQQQHGYEHLGVDTPVHLYADIDVDPKLNPDLAADPMVRVLGVLDDVARFAAARLRRLFGDAWFDAHLAAYLATTTTTTTTSAAGAGASAGAAAGAGDAAWIQWSTMTSTRPTKLSYHVVGHMFGGRVMFRNNSHVGALVRAYVHAHPDRYTHCTPLGVREPLFDSSVYSRHRFFRLLWSSKWSAAAGGSVPLYVLNRADGSVCTDMDVAVPTFEAFAAYLVAYPYVDVLRETVSMLEHDDGAVRWTSIWDIPSPSSSLSSSSGSSNGGGSAVLRRSASSATSGRVALAGALDGGAAGNEGGVAQILSTRRKRRMSDAGDGASSGGGGGAGANNDDDGGGDVDGDGDPAFEAFLQTAIEIAVGVVVSSADAAHNAARAVSPIAKYFPDRYARGGAGALKIDVPGWHYCGIARRAHGGNNVYYMFQLDQPHRYQQRCYSHKGCQRQHVEHAMPAAAAERLRAAHQQYRDGLVVDFASLLPPPTASMQGPSTT